jgi:hypothetical protein
MASGDKIESAKNKKSDLGVLGDNPVRSGVSVMPPPVYEKGLGDGSGSIPVPQFGPARGPWDEEEGAPNFHKHIFDIFRYLIQFFRMTI